MPGILPLLAMGHAFYFVKIGGEVNRLGIDYIAAHGEDIHGRLFSDRRF
jgi:hypothetical protein